MKTASRKYWEEVSEEMEEAAADEVDQGIFDSLPDLESLASTCPFADLSNRLLMNARVIHLRLENDFGVERTREEVNKDYLNYCLGVYDDC